MIKLLLLLIMSIGIDKLNSMLEIKLNHVISNQNQKIKLISIVSKQQRTIGNIEREKNIIISGMTEGLMEDKDMQYENDEQEISALLKLIGIYLPSGYKILRFGKENLNYHSTIKMTVISEALQKLEENKAKEIKNNKGKLKIDVVIIDQNLFLHRGRLIHILTILTQSTPFYSETSMESK